AGGDAGPQRAVHQQDPVGGAGEGRDDYRSRDEGFEVFVAALRTRLGFGVALTRERRCPCPPPERFESSARGTAFPATLRCNSKPRHALGYALPGGVALWAKSRRRPKAGGHSPKGPPHPARSAVRSWSRR